jgi:hypothetical protein
MQPISVVQALIKIFNPVGANKTPVFLTSIMKISF